MQKGRFKPFTFTVRPYRPEDWEAVRALCCDLGFLGKSIEHIFQDRKWFADLSTKYYLKCEPDSCFVADVDGQVVGYVLGSRHHLKFRFVFYFLIAAPLFAKAFFKYITRAYDKKSRTYIKKLVFVGGRDRARRPKKAAHIHTNIREEFRTLSVGKALYRSLFRHFLKEKVTLVWSELFHSDVIRTERFYSFYRFHIYDKKPTDIFENEFGKMYMMTITTDLTQKEVQHLWGL